eukprot:Phypoly_transcript_01313.p1 GENE.Phypoly_transcript_01313~~Phypoly_transcript_01313.p1  ORF type:complete len:815 (-),score=162.39 Phypoly_transcript_01313:291-2735(-)
MGKDKNIRRDYDFRRERLEKKLAKERIYEEDTHAREDLRDRIVAAAPAKGTNPLANTEGNKEHWFKDYPISYQSQTGLFNAGYIKATDIQHATLLHALCGRDVLAAAKTGSGKTLAFLVPVLERLYHSVWQKDDGLGALIITPTRELAMQIFQVLAKIGVKHEFSAGLLIGGKNIIEEKASIARMNILIATPGRLLQHMDETPTFNCDNLRILVLDEADRILDMGFQETMNHIIEFLPQKRQTLLFSATQTRSIRDLARLSLQTPEFISDMKNDVYNLPPPEQLQQSLMVVPLWEKMNCLWSFLKSHLNSKIVIFFSTGKQIRYVHAVISKMRSGKKVFALHGNMNQTKRMIMYNQFESTPSSALLATDVAARGLDFPSVDWIFQFDCPDTPETYIHRVGRTARHQATGKSLLLLTPEEEPGMTAALAKYQISPKRIKMNPSKQLQTGSALASIMAKHPDIKILALKAFVTYFKFVFVQPNKEIFEVQKLPAEQFARSLGLIAIPVINVLKNTKSGQEKVAQLEQYERTSTHETERAHKLEEHLKRLEEEEEANAKKAEAPEKRKTSLQKMLERKNPLQENTLLQSISKPTSDDEEVLVTKKGPHLHEVIKAGEEVALKPLSKAAKKKQKKKAFVQPTTGPHLKFDDDGETRQVNVLAAPKEKPPLQYFAEIKAMMQESNREDKQHAKDIRKAKKYAAMDRKREARQRELYGEEGGYEEDDSGYYDEGGEEREGDGEDEGEGEGEEYNSVEGGREEKEEEEDRWVPKQQETNRSKKHETKRKREQEEPEETLEDLEAQAKMLLAKKLKSRGNPD